MSAWRLAGFILLCFAWPDQGTICVVHAESLAYPDVAWATQIQRTVQVHVEVSPTGEVTSASAISGHPVLKTAAEANAKRWKFNPGSERQTEIRYEFALEEPKTYYKPETKNLYEFPDHVRIISSLRTPTH